jgi:HK97 family phage portal protein
MAWWNNVKGVRMASEQESKMLAEIEGIKAQIQTGVLPKDQANLLNQMVYSFFNKGGVSYLQANSQTYVKEGYMSNEIIYSIVTRILDKKKIAPLELLKKVPDQKNALLKYKSFKYDSKPTSQAMKSSFRKKALEEIEKGDLNDLLQRPNPQQNTEEFIESAAGFWNVCGEVFIYGVAPENGPNAGCFKELYVLPSHLVEIVQGDVFEPVRGYKLLIGEQKIEIPAANVLHMKRWNPFWDLSGTQLRGQSPLRAGVKRLAINNKSIDFRGGALENGGVAGLITPRDEKTNWQPGQVNAINDKVKDKILGSDNANKIIAFSQSVDYTQVGMSPVDLQVLEGMRDDVPGLCGLWGFPPVLLGYKDATFENQEKAQKALVSNICLPFYNNFENKLINWLMPAYNKRDKCEYVVDFDTTVFAELQPDLKLIKEVFGNSYQVKGNEYREMIGLEEDPDMDKFFIPNNLMSLEDFNSVDQPIDPNAQQDY